MVASSTTVCPSCCAMCIAGNSGPSETFDSSSPYALNKLVPAGTITFQLDPDQAGAGCDHAHSEDGWHLFEGKNFDQRLVANNELCREMDFLIKHRFISVTYRLGPSMSVVLRIYIIPHDLADVQGQLRIRKEIILAPARRYLRNLLPNVIQDRESWDRGVCPFNQSPTLVPSVKDRRTLGEIYGDLKSPEVKVTPGWEHITGRLLDFQDNLKGLGMRSTLYKYQRRSVAAMMHKELDTSDIPDPLFIPLTSLNRETFYLQPGTMEVLREQPTVAASQSGILCEELGTGKTVMILALVLATIDQISSPEESIVDDRPVLTPLAFRYFPSSECIAARKRFHRSREDTFPIQGSRVPSLVELLVHRRRTTPDTRIFNLNTPSGLEIDAKMAEMKAQVDQIPPGELLRLNAPFYYHYRGEPTVAERSPRKSSDPGPRKMFLTSATLIIVPPNLLSQWDREIHKHCEYPLRVLILRSGTPMPSVTSLASDYDIILMTYKRFTIENNHNKIQKLHSWKVCTCPTIPGSRVPDCTCKVLDVSPLLQIRWKRLVIDEGHVSASLSTVLTPFTKLLSVERRWIVTGTPTTNLLGLSLGEKTNKKARRQAEDGMHSDGDGSDSGSEGSEQSQDPSVLPSPSSSPLPASNVPPRVWTKYDREDLGKLGKMISHFIAVPQFTACPKLVSTHVIEPLLDPQGPRPGAIQVLNQVMEMIMIRHRIEDVEEDIFLPPVMHESVLLDLDPYAVKSYNAMQAAIVINAVDSQRTDQDYMFHPRNADVLQTTVKNMSQVMFWSTDDSLYNVDEIVRNSQEFIDVALSRNTPQEDLTALKEALKHVMLAAQDPLWRAMQCHEDVPYRIRGIGRRIFEAWTRMPQSEPTHDGSLVGFIHSDRLLKMQDLIIQRPRMSEDVFIEWGGTVAAEDVLLRRLYVESQKGNERKSNTKIKPHQEEINAGLKAEDAAKKARDPNTLKEMKKDLDIAMTQLNEYEDGEGHSAHPTALSVFAPAFEPHGGSILSTSLLGSARLGSTASSKLNYIINEVLRHAAKEKFLIFSDSQLSLAHIAESLQLMHVKFLRFTTQIDPRRREQMVLTFETSEKYRVFLMELKHGARGLNLISASRVIFCEPVWQADVESQAIKRAHRIGQTRPITVKTLAIRGTAEENMVARRNMLKGSQQKLPKLIEEAGMRHYIANPKFIDYKPERYSTVDMPLLTVQTQDTADTWPVVMSPSTKRIRPVDPVLSSPEEGEASPTKKKRVVRFE
ncbi:putative SNF2 family protein N-terminal domain [Lyophyllum shimeji]|uniref:SNF2 family protein N-terminal domain n=1 Tax=Lyophyllum shimeji TaxID=47721 RepID=A0A9P3PFS2_LYOSH|nr:putative SNF2 family protein N-terminal domain [Lyophyllum shimeji]